MLHQNVCAVFSHPGEKPWVLGASLYLFHLLLKFSFSYLLFQHQLEQLLEDLHEPLFFPFHPRWLICWASHQNLTCCPVGCPEFHLAEKPLSLFWVPWEPGQSMVQRSAEPHDPSPEAEHRKGEHPQSILLRTFQTLVNHPLLTILCSPAGWENKPHDYNLGAGSLAMSLFR